MYEPLRSRTCINVRTRMALHDFTIMHVLLFYQTTIIKQTWSPSDWRRHNVRYSDGLIANYLCACQRVCAMPNCPYVQAAECEPLLQALSFCIKTITTNSNIVGVDLTWLARAGCLRLVSGSNPRQRTILSSLFISSTH